MASVDMDSGLFHTWDEGAIKVPVLPLRRFQIGIIKAR